MQQHSTTSDDDVIHALYKSNHPTVVPMVILSGVSSDVLRIPFDAVRNVLTMTATPLPKIVKYVGNEEHKHVCKIVVVGEGGCGKTSLLLRFVRDEFTSTYVSTVGIDLFLYTIQYKTSLVVKLVLLDVAGIEKYQPVRDPFRGAEGVMMCYAVNDRPSFERVSSYWMVEFQRYCDVGLPLVLVGLKADVEGGSDRVISTEEGETLALRCKIPFVECSAKDDVNISTVFEMLLEQYFSQQQQQTITPPSVINSVIPPKRTCCIS